MAPLLPVSLQWAATLPLDGEEPCTIWILSKLAKLLSTAPSALWQAAQPAGPADMYNAVLKLFQNLDAELARVLTQHPGAASAASVASGGPFKPDFGSRSQRAEWLTATQVLLLRLTEEAKPRAMTTAA